jgi:hypothetical protein
MHDPIKTIQSLGLDTTSPVFLVQAVKETTPYTQWSKQKFDETTTIVLYGSGVADELKVNTDSKIHAKYFFMYVCQTFINLHNKTMVADSDTVRTFALSNCATFMLNNKLALELEEGGSVDGSEEIKRRTGTKTEICNSMYLEYKDMEDHREKFIQECITELGMSRSGALTYFHNARKRNDD